MASLLRKIRRTRWDKQIFASTMPWLPHGDMAADPLGDLATVNGAISVFEVPNPDFAQYIAAAIAAGGDALSNVDYIVFDSEILDPTSVKIEKAPGDSPAPDINELHRHIAEISAARLLAIARLIFEKGTTNRISHKILRPIIEDGVKNKQWTVKPKLKQCLTSR